MSVAGKHHAERWRPSGAARGPAWPVAPSVLVVGPELTGQRLDQALIPLLGSARAAREWLTAGRIFCNGVAPFGAGRVQPGDVLSFFGADDDPMVRAEALALPVLYEDETLLVVEKPAGIPMYPGPGWPCRTVANGVRALGPGSALKGELRAGILGRLDREVSGVIAVARDAAAHADIIGQYVRREVRRRYLALVGGAPHDGHSALSLLTRREGKSGYRAVLPGTPYAIPAETSWRCIGRAGAASFVEVSPVTGRRHQIRVHLAAAGMPILGDRQYGGELGRVRDRGGPDGIYPGVGRVALHLETLALTHPRTGDRMTFFSPWPSDLPAVTLG